MVNVNVVGLLDVVDLLLGFDHLLDALLDVARLLLDVAGLVDAVGLLLGVAGLVDGVVLLLDINV